MSELSPLAEAIANEVEALTVDYLDPTVPYWHCVTNAVLEVLRRQPELFHRVLKPAGWGFVEQTERGPYYHLHGTLNGERSRFNPSGSPYDTQVWVVGDPS